MLTFYMLEVLAHLLLSQTLHTVTPAQRILVFTQMIGPNSWLCGGPLHYFDPDVQSYISPAFSSIFLKQFAGSVFCSGRGMRPVRECSQERKLSKLRRRRILIQTLSLALWCHTLCKKGRYLNSILETRERNCFKLVMIFLLLARPGSHNYVYEGLR